MRELKKIASYMFELSSSNKVSFSFTKVFMWSFVIGRHCRGGGIVQKIVLERPRQQMYFSANKTKTKNATSHKMMSAREIA